MKRNQQRNSREFLKEKHDDGFACDGIDESGHDETCHHHAHVAGQGDDH